MQHDKAVGLQKAEIEHGGESEIAALVKNSKTIKIDFFCRTTWYIWLKFCIQHWWDLDFQNYRNKKVSVAELGHSDLLPVYKSCAKMQISPKTLNRVWSHLIRMICITFSQNDLQMESFQII